MTKAELVAAVEAAGIEVKSPSRMKNEDLLALLEGAEKASTPAVEAVEKEPKVWKRHKIQALIEAGNTRKEVVAALEAEGIHTTVGYVGTIASNYDLTLVTERQKAKAAKEAEAAQAAEDQAGE